jgi:hypothetical protein
MDPVERPATMTRERAAVLESEIGRKDWKDEEEDCVCVFCHQKRVTSK